MAPQTQQQALPKTPVPAHAELPLIKDGDLTRPTSLTPPPSSQPAPPRQAGAATPRRALSQLSSPPPSTILRARVRSGENSELAPLSQDQLETMSADELRKVIIQINADAQDAKTAAAHYKLQHQMAQMESGEAVERMAVEMEMARREIEVLQQAEAQLRCAEKAAARSATTEDERYLQKVHVDVFAAMTAELRDLKVGRVQMEHELAQSRRVIEQQEKEIASLQDKVLLMRERIKESRDQMHRNRRLGTQDGSPYTARTSPYQTPVSERFRPMFTPQSQASRHLHPVQRQPHIALQQPQPAQQTQQEGFAALLQATDIVSQSGHSPRAEHRRNTHSLSSLPTTPSRTAPPIPATLYTPQPHRQMPIEVPQTAPLPRKRPIDSSPAPRRSAYDSDGTVSAADDSEAETEVADEEVNESRASQYARDLLRSPTAKRAKSKHNLKDATQTRLFAPVTKSMMERGDQDREQKRARTGVEGVSRATTEGR